ncbi:DNA alkylation repair protein [Rhizobium rosettiformans]|uniref:DNA alkylation repair protein n=1 Tax=Rhizobium rosettiformans TaxID=1368430 RepID=UPI0028652F0A|nr:DNA alkylation repair protein [Rhizobium rosettiformans]MDR7029539.1 3-methyladenine DNA glycosylase AlkC [Rhizobium rosettiformans]MDR7063253.1 3-methyladenine DNA glycosylase AlkC [Rhizobium rosettiformans]
MAEPLKHLIGPHTARDTADAVARAWGPFDHAAFLTDTLPGIDSLELMQRGQCIADALRRHLPGDFETAARILSDCLPAPEASGLSGWALLSFNQYIARHGRGHLATALDLLKALTPHFTAEFGIRPFIAEEQDAALAVISSWVLDPNHHVRRLASEGTRPRLPWAMRLPQLVVDPTPILPILEALVDDPEDYVRRSVANSLNDIAKDHPDLVADFVERHAKAASKERLWLLKHASRTLIKKGHGKALANFGFAALTDVTATVSLSNDSIPFPGELTFDIRLSNTGAETRTVLVDYAIHHQKKDGSLSPKVFKGKSLTIGAGESVTITKRHAFRPITTRVYHPGMHRLEVMLNGGQVAIWDFHLNMPKGDKG